MEKRSFLIPLFCAGTFLYLGVRYGMYALEGWPYLTYSENLLQMLVWGAAHSVVIFLLVATTLFAVIRNTKNYVAKLLSLIFLEVLGVGVLSGTFIIKGLIADPWYIVTLALFAGLTAFLSILYVSILEAERKKEKIVNVKDRLFFDRLKLEHKKYLQFMNSMCWMIIFALLGYLSIFSPVSHFRELTLPLPSLLRLCVIDMSGAIYFSLGFTLGVIWQLYRRMNQIENMIFKLAD